MKRSEKIAFAKVGAEDTYSRMTGFTELSTSKNPKEYSRKYVDEDAERTSVVSYAPSMTYKFDEDTENTVHQKFAAVADNELVGDSSIIDIVIVDLSSPVSEGGSTFKAVKRGFSIVPNSEGDDADTYTRSGELKAFGAAVHGSATTTDEWKTLTFTTGE